MLWNAAPCSGVATSFTSPLTECTSAIHNLDNIQNGVPFFTPNKKTTSLQLVGRGKTAGVAAQRISLPVAAKKYTNDPYSKTAFCGAPIFTPPALSPEASFMLSYGEEEHASCNVTMAALPPPPPRPQPTHSLPSGDYRSAQRSGTQGQFCNFLSVLPVVPAADSARHMATAATERTVTVLKTGHAAARNEKSRCVRGGAFIQQSLATSSASASSSAVTTASTSVTHVRCKRVYVNGRPVTVWLNGDGETIL